MTGKKAIELLENVANCEFMPQTIRSIEKSLTQRGVSKASSVIHSKLGHKFDPVYKANAVADRSENQFTQHYWLIKCIINGFELC
jgi:hypothetical protein